MEGMVLKLIVHFFVNHPEFLKQCQCGRRKFWHLGGGGCYSAHLKKKYRENIKCLAEYIEAISYFLLQTFISSLQQCSES